MRCVWPAPATSKLNMAALKLSLTDGTFTRLWEQPIVRPIVYWISHIWRYDHEHNYIKIEQLRPPVMKMVTGSINSVHGNQFCLLFYHFSYWKLHTELPMTRNVLSIEAVGRRANNVLLPHSIQPWDNECWSNKVIEEQLDQSWQIPPSKLEQYCMGCWPGLITDR